MDIATALDSEQAEQTNRDISRTIDRSAIDTRRAAQQKIREAHAAYLATQYAPEGLSNRALAALYSRAWEQGHSSGFSSVESEYQDLSDFLVEVLGSKS